MHCLRSRKTYGHRKGDLTFNHGGHGVGDQWSGANSKPVNRIKPTMSAAETIAFLKRCSQEAESLSTPPSKKEGEF